MVGYAAVSWFLKYIPHNRFIPFVVNRVLLGIAFIGLVTIGALNPDAGTMGRHADIRPYANQPLRSPRWNSPSMCWMPSR